MKSGQIRRYGTAGPFGPCQNANFADVLGRLRDFLTAHPRGKVVLAVMNGAHGGRFAGYGLAQFAG